MNGDESRLCDGSRVQSQRDASVSKRATGAVGATCGSSLKPEHPPLVCARDTVPGGLLYGRSSARLRPMDVPSRPPQASPLPEDLPRPEDDGAAAQVAGTLIPDVAFPSTDRGQLNLAEVADGGLVLYVFPRMGRPDERDPAGWKEVPGAYGCTAQSCAFRDRHRSFSGLGFTVAGLSAQTPREQQEAAQRLRLPFPLLADPTRRLSDALRLPTFSIAGMTLYKRLTLVARDRRIAKVFYPVFPPDENPEKVLEWLESQAS
jgi:peroxiredoxin